MIVPSFLLGKYIYLFISCAPKKKYVFRLLFYYERSLLLLVSIQNMSVRNMNELFNIQEAKPWIGYVTLTLLLFTLNRIETYNVNNV